MKYLSLLSLMAIFSAFSTDVHAYGASVTPQCEKPECVKAFEAYAAAKGSCSLNISNGMLINNCTGAYLEAMKADPAIQAACPECVITVTE